MRVVVDTNVFVSAALKEKSIPGVAVHTVAESGILLKSTITERELFVTLARPRLAPLIWHRRRAGRTTPERDSQVGCSRKI